jgi:hypothetical protein
MAEKHWIQGAIKRPGQLHRDLGIPQGKTIPQKALARALSGEMGKAVQRRAQLAKTLKGMNG